MIQCVYLGRIAYDEALSLQDELAAARYDERVGNVLLLLEHPPVLTLGRNADRTNVLVSDEQLAARGITLHKISRGGDVTYHGPGQLVGYPIFDLRSLRNASGTRMGPVDFVRRMEDALMGVCGAWGVHAGRISGLTGVWCGSVDGSPSAGSNGAAGAAPARKIAAIGIHVSRGITSHGFAFNVTTNLKDFALINPCGITDKPVTGLDLEMPPGTAVPALEDVAQEAARQFGAVLGETVEIVASLDALRAQIQAAREFPARNFPAEDTPMRVPRQVERLRHEAERPVRA